MTKSKRLVILIGLLGIYACSFTGLTPSDKVNKSLNKKAFIDNSDYFTRSGSLTLSFPIISNQMDKDTKYSIINNSAKDASDSIKEGQNSPVDLSAFTDSNKTTKYAPLIGFIPVHASFKPADNEVWLEINKEESICRVYKGEEKLKEVMFEGEVTLPEGRYPLQHKQKNPLWYASDDYFSKRKLSIPPRGGHFRFRRGALGTYAIYPTVDFIIHSGPFWSEEIGGLKLKDEEMSAIFMMLDIGSTVIVK